MNNKSVELPVYLSLIENRGEKTERLIKEMKDLSISLGLSEEVSLKKITPTVNTSPDENSLIYCLALKTDMSSDKSQGVYKFLQHVFKQLFNKYPAFVEPPEGNQK